MSKISSIAVCGAGTMGSGIALVAARAGYPTIIFDMQATALERAKEQNHAFLAQQLAKGRITDTDMQAALDRLTYTDMLQECKADLIIEAIVEKMAVKVDLFNKLAAVNNPASIFASNTSSLSITELASQVPGPERVAGLHFFNPAPLMKLVEIVATSKTSSTIIEQLQAIVKEFGKTGVVCKDAPGFIVNRVARHFYLEALNIAENTKVDFATIDQLLENAGFKMGPFKLMDLIGNDINFAVTTSLYEACNHASRFKPSALQQQKVLNNELGRKTGKGYYQY